MPATTVSASPASKSNSIPVRKISNADADAALREGWGDFMEMRGDLIFVGLIYVLVGVVAATAVMGGALLPLLFPIVAGVGLLGPVAALGFYEMARRRESGLQSNWQHFLDVRKRPGANEIGVVAGPSARNLRGLDLRGQRRSTSHCSAGGSRRRSAHSCRGSSRHPKAGR